MSSWSESNWFEDIVSKMRVGISESLSIIDDDVSRLRVATLLKRDFGFKRPPESLSGKELVVELVKSMTVDRIKGGDLNQYDGICSQLPPLQQIRDALLSPAFYDNVKIPPTPAVMVDSRIEAKEVWNRINVQVFDSQVDA